MPCPPSRSRWSAFGRPGRCWSRWRRTSAPDGHTDDGRPPPELRPVPAYLNCSRKGTPVETTDVVTRAHELMPSLLRRLEELVAIPSIAFPGFPAEPVEQMGHTTLAMF